MSLLSDAIEDKNIEIAELRKVIVAKNAEIKRLREGIAEAVEYMDYDPDPTGPIAKQGLLRLLSPNDAPEVPAPETPKTKWLQMSDDTAFEDGEWVCFRFGDQSLSMFQWRENGRWFYQIEAGTETILYRDHANKLNYIRISPEV